MENQDDYYSTEAGYVHTQDQQGVHVMYDEALSDLKELEAELLLVASHYIEKEKGQKSDLKKSTNQTNKKREGLNLTTPISKYKCNNSISTYTFLTHTRIRKDRALCQPKCPFCWRLTTLSGFGYNSSCCLDSLPSDISASPSGCRECHAGP